MFKKRIIIFVALGFLVTSCGDTLDSVKRGITGSKKQSVDEFLVQKKDPLVLPPDFESLPTPDEQEAAEEEIVLGKALSQMSTSEEVTSPSSSAEESKLKKIKKQ